MSRQPEKQARAEAMLGELGLMVAKALAVRLRESEDVGETAALAGAFQVGTTENTERTRKEIRSARPTDDLIARKARAIQLGPDA